MRIVATAIPGLLLLFMVGCQRAEEAWVPESCIVETDAKSLFYELTPACSSGEHYLKVSDGVDYVWLFGAFNNGRREENVLVEREVDSVRIRAWWLTRAGNMWCMDTTISIDEFDLLFRKLEACSCFELPNMQPDVSHAMTYWVKLRHGEQEHEACAYFIDEVRQTRQFDNPKDKDFALNWSNIVSVILQMRQNRLFAIRPAAFDANGEVVWDLPASQEQDTNGIFGW